MTKIVLLLRISFAYVAAASHVIAIIGKTLSRWLTSTAVCIHIATRKYHESMKLMSYLSMGWMREWI